VRVLVTNDDGVDSVGIMVLAGAARDLGLEVLVAAPTWNSSGASGALTAVQRDGDVVIEPRDVPSLAGVTVLGVQAAPAFIARAAVRGAFGPAPDLVLSGINAGPNTGQAVLHSGTVCAALTAFIHGCPAMAVSNAAFEPEHWDTPAHVARPMIEWLLTTTEPVILNVNVPDCPLDDLRGVQQAPLATFGSVQTRHTESGKGHVKIHHTDLAANEPESDAALLAAGFATITPLSAVTYNSTLDITQLAPPTA
jgi:5'-nucleotidase